MNQADLDEGRRQNGLTSEERAELRRLRREKPSATVGAGDPLKSRGLVRSGDRVGTTEAFRFVRANQDSLPVATMCRLLDVSASGYYAWLERTPSARAVSDAELLEKIRAIYIASRGTYGAPRILHELRETHELHVSRKRVARLMREAGIQGVHRRKRAHTTIRDDDARPAPDLVYRNFEVDRPDRLWVADITYVPTWSGFLFLAVVRRVLDTHECPSRTRTVASRREAGTRRLDRLRYQRPPETPCTEWPFGDPERPPSRAV